MTDIADVGKIVDLLRRTLSSRSNFKRCELVHILARPAMIDARSANKLEGRFGFSFF
jgi:hypothetical protein